MASSDSTQELEDPPACFKSVVWESFGFPVKYGSKGERVVDRTMMVCRHCKAAVRYVSGNTSNMLTHIRRHHPDGPVTGVGQKKTTVVQQLIPAAFKQPLGVRADRTKAITEAIGIYILSAMCPFTVVEDPGFKHLLNVLEPCYTVPSPSHIRQYVVPSLYTCTRAVIEHKLSTVALTTDGWTSPATESSLTVTAHFNSKWEMKSPVLQTRPVYEQHTSTHPAENLQEAVAEWKLKPVAVTTDNERNIVNAVSDAGLGPHIGCFAHTLNLASQKRMAVSQVSQLLGKTAGFFHRSSVAARILETKQMMLNLPKHCLIHDVLTHWNSSYEMVE